MSDLFDNPTPIKAISFWQPWASLIAAGVKHHETRHWATAHRGQLAIHAAKRLDVAGAPEKLCQRIFGLEWMSILPRGGVVAIGDLTSCIDAEQAAKFASSDDLQAGNFAPGRFAWRIENVRALAEPIPVLGRQGLFNWSAPVDLPMLSDAWLRENAA